MILDEIIDELSYDLKQRKIINICVGTSYTAVILDDQSMGVSHTIAEGEVDYAGEIIGKNAYDVAVDVDNPLKRSISVAILNSISTGKLTSGDPLTLYSGGKVCAFGYYPYISAGNFSSVVLYDFSTQPQNNAKPFSQFNGETCDVAVIFGSALINNTIDKILKNVKADHLILTGISSVEAISTLKKYGFEAIGKIVPVDQYRAFRTICEGGSAKQLSKYVTKMYLKI